MRILVVCMALAGCASGRSSTTDAGTLVRRNLQVQAFEGVLSHTGQPRSLDALKGHPTVVWFFPMAGTPG